MSDSNTVRCIFTVTAIAVLLAATAGIILHRIRTIGFTDLIEQRDQLEATLSETRNEVGQLRDVIAAKDAAEERSAADLQRATERAQSVADRLGELGGVLGAIETGDAEIDRAFRELRFEIGDIATAVLRISADSNDNPNQ